MDAFSNFAVSTLTGTLTNVATTASVASGDGARFPSVPFNASIWDSTTYTAPDLDPAREIVRVTARATDALTFTRAQEGTAAVAHSNTVSILAGLTAKTLNNDVSRMLFDMNTNPPPAAAGAAGEVSYMTRVIAAGTLEIGDAIDIWTQWRHGGGTANAPRYGLKFGATYVNAILGIGATEILTSMYTRITINLASGAKAQAAHGYMGRENVSFIAIGSSQPAETIANAITLDWRHRFDAGAETNVIEGYTVFLLKRK